MGAGCRSSAERKEAQPGVGAGRVVPREHCARKGAMDSPVKERSRQTSSMLCKRRHLLDSWIFCPSRPTDISWDQLDWHSQFLENCGLSGPGFLAVALCTNPALSKSSLR